MPRRKGKGRPPLLTPERQAQLIHAIQANATMKLACEYAGISYHSFRNWMLRGETEFERLEALRHLPHDHPDYQVDPQPSKDEARYVDFFKAITDANAVASVGWLEVIDKAATMDAQWSAWMLGKRMPADYGPQSRPDVLVNPSAPTEGGGSEIVIRIQYVDSTERPQVVDDQENPGRTDSPSAPETS